MVLLWYSVKTQIRRLPHTITQADNEMSSPVISAYLDEPQCYEYMLLAHFLLAKVTPGAYFQKVG